MKDELPYVPIWKDSQEILMKEKKKKQQQQGTKQCGLYATFWEKGEKHLLKLSLKDTQNATNSDHRRGGGWEQGVWSIGGKKIVCTALPFIIFTYFFFFVSFVFFLIFKEFLSYLYSFFS